MHPRRRRAVSLRTSSHMLASPSHRCSHRRWRLLCDYLFVRGRHSSPQAINSTARCWLLTLYKILHIVALCGKHHRVAFPAVCSLRRLSVCGSRSSKRILRSPRARFRRSDAHTKAINLACNFSLQYTPHSASARNNIHPPPPKAPRFIHVVTCSQGLTFKASPL